MCLRVRNNAVVAEMRVVIRELADGTFVGMVEDYCTSETRAHDSIHGVLKEMLERAPLFHYMAQNRQKGEALAEDVGPGCEWGPESTDFFGEED